MCSLWAYSQNNCGEQPLALSCLCVCAHVSVFLSVWNASAPTS